MADANVIRSFLVSLGFNVDEAGNKKFNEGIESAGKNVDRLARGLALMAVATVESIKTYAEQMQRLYYASQLSGASAQNLSALGFGFQQIGLSAEQAKGSIGAMAQAMASNPGLRGLMNGMLGQDTSKMDTVKVFMEFLDKLKTMPEHIAMQRGSMFGIDPQTLRQLMKNKDVLADAIKQYKDEQKKAGISDDNMTEQGKKLSQAWNDIKNKVDNLTKALNENFYPVAMKILGWGNDFLDVMLKLNKSTDGWSTGIASIVALFVSWKTAAWGVRSALSALGLGGAAEAAAGGAAASGGAGGVGLMAWLSRSVPWVAGLMAMLHSKDLNQGEDALVESWKHPKQPQSSADKKSYLEQLESKYKLPKGILYGMWGTESGFGKNQFNAQSGAAGNFQFLPGTARQYGVTIGNFNSEASGAARYLRDLYDKRGSWQSALMGYNGVVKNYRAGAEYVSRVQKYGNGVNLNQTTNINLAGSGQDTARDIARAQQRVNAGLARNLAVAMQ